MAFVMEKHFMVNMLTRLASYFCHSFAVRRVNNLAPISRVGDVQQKVPAALNGLTLTGARAGNGCFKERGRRCPRLGGDGHPAKENPATHAIPWSVPRHLARGAGINPTANSLSNKTCSEGQPRGSFWLGLFARVVGQM
jgi:hypothetical protein